MSGSMISFDEIPYDWRVPGTYLEVRPDRRRQGLAPYPQRTLLIAPKLAAGNGATLNSFRLTRADQARIAGGDGSIPAQMAESFFANNRTGEVWMMLLDDPTGGATRATASITFTGTPTAAGNAVVAIGGRRVTIPVNVGETPTVLATRLVAAITASSMMPVTAANTAGVVTLTARHFGLVGNSLAAVVCPWNTNPLPAGLSAAVTAFSGGTGEADIAPAISAIASQWWTDMVVPTATGGWNAPLVTELDRRWNAMTRLDAHVWQAMPGSFSTLSSWGAAQNSRFMTTLGVPAGSISPPWVWAAAMAGVGVFHLTNDPARQLRGLTLAGVEPPPPAARLIDTERDLLLRDGVSTITVTDDGAVALERVITAYQRTSLNVEDTAWLDVMTVKTMSRIRYDWSAYMSQAWPRAKLADDDSTAAVYDPQVATCRRLHASWATRLRLYAQQGWVNNAERSAADSTFVRDGTDAGRVNARQYVQVLGNLMTLAGVLEFSQ
jgi:phage tail sheath gpL-like